MSSFKASFSVAIRFTPFSVFGENLTCVRNMQQKRMPFLEASQSIIQLFIFLLNKHAHIAPKAVTPENDI